MDGTNAMATVLVFLWDDSFLGTPASFLGCDVYLPPLNLIATDTTDGAGDVSIPALLPVYSASLCGEAHILQAGILPGMPGDSIQVTNAWLISLGF